jgi:hypothetical protein
MSKPSAGQDPERSEDRRYEDETKPATLPAGVTKAEWGRELGRWQNPRIRAFLGCLRVLDTVLESNVAILHCSPRRLDEMLKTVRGVAKNLRSDIRLLLNGPSVIPELEASRQAIAAHLNHVEQTLLGGLDEFPDPVTEDRHDDLRRYLCVAIGQLNRFLQDSFGSLVAADPRATHDADYYLSKEFPRDIEEAEWLYDSVNEIDEHLRSMEPERIKLLNEVVHTMQAERQIVFEERWAATNAYLDGLIADLTPRLRRVVALRGIRLEELELLNHYSNEIPSLCRIVSELYESSIHAITALEGDPEEAGEAGEEDHAAPEVEIIHRALCDRLIPQMKSLDDCLRDLEVFIPLWRRGISQRRALLLHPPVLGGDVVQSMR